MLQIQCNISPLRWWWGIWRCQSPPPSIFGGHHCHVKSFCWLLPSFLYMSTRWQLMAVVSYLVMGFCNIQLYTWCIIIYSYPWPYRLEHILIYICYNQFLIGRVVPLLVSLFCNFINFLGASILVLLSKLVLLIFSEPHILPLGAELELKSFIDSCKIFYV